MRAGLSMRPGTDEIAKSVRGEEVFSKFVVWVRSKVMNSGLLVEARNKVPRIHCKIRGSSEATSRICERADKRCPRRAVPNDDDCIKHVSRALAPTSVLGSSGVRHLTCCTHHSDRICGHASRCRFTHRPSPLLLQLRPPHPGACKVCRSKVCGYPRSRAARQRNKHSSN
ncbi:hypothetical protein CC80DRAFT_24358 [Byssothecium circinans]|uniref:C3H1-type domain-containing protein n=1 Tax=Byssothecium circinans TaxID=147558 RepID=A0A6A5U1I7_9PLEO|nr:hypothetical protein CC80DRAFT_317776 [Byssothecium circinans]KAF1959023.1 hypothetical protein CC80DRAFT_24358 [Byssothecium circinans]